MVKYRNFGQKSNFGRKSKFWSNIAIFDENRIFVEYFVCSIIFLVCESRAKFFTVTKCLTFFLEWISIFGENLNFSPKFWFWNNISNLKESWIFDRNFYVCQNIHSCPEVRFLTESFGYGLKVWKSFLTEHFRPKFRILLNFHRCLNWPWKFQIKI